MISAGLHFSLSCDRCSCGYGELPDPQNIQGALRGTGWGIIGHHVFCDRCFPEALKEPELWKGEVPEPDQDWGKETENGWIKTSEQIPPAGVPGVLWRNCQDKTTGIGTYNYFMNQWEDDKGNSLEFIPDYWRYIPAFP